MRRIKRDRMMRGREFSILLLLLLMAAVPRHAWAQAGSTGGSVFPPGKSGKSATGSDEAPAARPAPKPRVATAPKDEVAGCGRSPAGVWSWSAAGTTLTTTMSTNGGASTSNGYTGTWRCADGMYSLTWMTGSTDHFRVSADGKTLSGNIGVMGMALTGTRQ